MDRRQQLLLSWETNADNWIQAVRDGLIPSRRAGTDRAILDAILRRAPKRLLDVGCGEGWLVRRVADAAGCKAVGVDASEPLILAARAADPKNRYEVLSYDDLIAEKDNLGGGFNVIAFNYALFDEDAARLLGAMRRRLSGDGAMIIQSLHPHAIGPTDDEGDAWRVEDFSAFESQGWAPMPWYFRTLESWHRVIREAGLTMAELSEPSAGPDLPALSLLMVCTATS